MDATGHRRRNPTNRRSAKLAGHYFTGWRSWDACHGERLAGGRARSPLFGRFFAGGFIWSWREHCRRASFRLLISLVLAGTLAVGLGVSAIPVYLGIPEMVRHIGRGAIMARQLDFTQYVQWRLEETPSVLCNYQV